jgi:hypothetical protein
MHLTDFDTVWAYYPRKVGKGAARKAFAKISPSAELVQKMLDAIKWQRNQPQWQKDSGAFIPHLATWLHQERWDDEPFELPQLKDQTVKNVSAVERWLKH